MTTGESGADTGVNARAHGRGRTLAVPAFPADDGTADAVLRDLVAGAPDGVQLARLLRSARLLACVVAVADEIDERGGDTSSHMAVVSMLNEAGERGLLAFTGVDSLAAWNRDARPVPALGRDVARSALEEGAVAVVIDVAGPVRTVVRGPDLEVLADTLDIDRVFPLVEAALAPLTADGWAEVELRDVRTESDDVDVLITVVTLAGGHPDGRGADRLASQAAGILQSRRDIQRLVPGGLGVVAAGSGSMDS